MKKLLFQKTLIALESIFLMSSRIVSCKKMEKDLPGLENPPFEGALGEEIFNNISAEAWALWNDDLMIKVINEYRLNLADEDHHNVLLDQMKAFLNLSEQKGSGVLEVENPDRGK